jgi:hypothetical protein
VSRPQRIFTQADVADLYATHQIGYAARQICVTWNFKALHGTRSYGSVISITAGPILEPFGTHSYGRVFDFTAFEILIKYSLDSGRVLADIPT